MSRQDDGMTIVVEWRASHPGAQYCLEAPTLDARWGDRRQKLVFVGLPEADRQALTAELDARLLPLPKTGVIDTPAWRTLLDPFREWRAA